MRLLFNNSMYIQLFYLFSIRITIDIELVFNTMIMEIII